MIRAIVIDDERPAIKELEFLLQAHAAIEVVGTYTNPQRALVEVQELNPQVVFLDINMPQLQGIDLASQLLDRCPLIQIVFVTAYDQYAVEAFELHALDYLLKPVGADRLAKTVQRITSKVSSSAPAVVGRALLITTFGRLSLGWSDQEPLRWRTEKTRELFAFLLHHAGREVRKEEIMDAVFPDLPPERAVHQLHNGIYYIKKALQAYGVSQEQVAIEGSYRLSLHDVLVDAMRFQALLGRARAEQEQIDLWQSAADLYQADYYRDGDWVWAEVERERLRKLHLEMALRLGTLYVQHAEIGRAEDLLLRVIRCNPYSEPAIRLLLELYLGSHRTTLAERLYREYERTLREDLDLAPPQDLRELISSSRAR